MTSLRTGLRTITTTLNGTIQRSAERHLAHALSTYGRARNIEDGAMVVMRPDGAILATVGGRDYRAGEWNYVTQAKRQPGSVAKLFVYLAALQGGMSARSMVSDDALTLLARPVRNFDDRYLGPITVEAALARSSNTAAVRLATGNARTIRTIAERLGVTTELAGEAGDLALGTNEATLMEMTAAYAALANRGARVIPYARRQRPALQTPRY